MLLFIFKSGVILKSKVDSNTSHVIVYRCYTKCRRYTKHIQIHLMLLFINCSHRGTAPEAVFKYISCYCLSRQSQNWGGKNAIQIHLMLLFIES